MNPKLSIRNSRGRARLLEVACLTSPSLRRVRSSGAILVAPDGRMILYTIGHSTRPIEEFIAILEAHGIRKLADIRTVPRSRHNPQFDCANLPPSLESAGIAYQHMPGLGGLRKARPDSVNLGWRNISFRGYADYLQTPEFQRALEQLIQTAQDQPTVIMCAEAVEWRCHRSLVSDTLLVRGIDVRHIYDSASAKPHKLTSFAQVRGTTVTYPSPDPQQHLEYD